MGVLLCDVMGVALPHVGHYVVCFDPLDGSSNIDAGISTGSIFGEQAAWVAVRHWHEHMVTYGSWCFACRHL